MLSEQQQVQLDDIIQRVSCDLFVESATFDTHNTLELVLCREFVCYRPMKITSAMVDCVAALDGDAIAQHALTAYLTSALEGM